MDDIEPLIVIYEEHKSCRKSNMIQYRLDTNQITYMKITTGQRCIQKNHSLYRLPAMFLGDIHFGSLRQLQDFLRSYIIEPSNREYQM